MQEPIYKLELSRNERDEVLAWCESHKQRLVASGDDSGEQAARAIERRLEAVEPEYV